MNKHCIQLKTISVGLAVSCQKIIISKQWFLRDVKYYQMIMEWLRVWLYRVRKSYVYVISWTTKRNGTDVSNLCTSILLRISFNYRKKLFQGFFVFLVLVNHSLRLDIEDLIDAQTNPTIAPLAGDGEVTLRINC